MKRFADRTIFNALVDKSDAERMHNYLIEVCESLNYANVSGELVQDAFTKQWVSIVKYEMDIEDE